MDLHFQLTISIDDLQNILDYEIENFETKFTKLKKKITVYEGVNKPSGSDETVKEQVNEDLQLELEDVKQKLKKEETKSKVLEQDVDELNALVDLYVNGSHKKDYLEEEYKDEIIQILKLKIKGLEEEMFCKIGKIYNLENTVIELRRELNKKDVEIANLDKKLSVKYSSC